MATVLWRCWLGGRKGIQPVKTEWWGSGVVICLERGADLHMFQLMPLPLTVSCFSKIQIGFAFLVPAHLGSHGKMTVKRVCVCVWRLSVSSLYSPVQPSLPDSGDITRINFWFTDTVVWAVIIQKPQKSLKVILRTITSPESQRYAE